MPFKIQRVPRLLNDFFSIFGGQTPTELEDRVRGAIELTQFYGLTQRRIVGTAATATAQNTNLAIPVIQQPFILFGMSVTCVITATITHCYVVGAIRYAGSQFQEAALVAGQLPTPGDTGNASLVWRAPYPLILPPGTEILGRPENIAVDATVTMVVGADIGVLG